MHVDNISEKNDQSKKLLTLIEELCKLYDEERMKGTLTITVYDLMDKFFMARQQKPEAIINWCLRNQINSIVQCILSDCYYYGKWVKKDEKMAFEFTKKSAKGGYIGAYSNLGFHYILGIGTEINHDKAFEYYQKSAEGGLPVGQFNLAINYENGEGTKINREMAFELYQKAAKGGYIKAYKSLGNCYRHGVGTEIDEEKAFECYQTAAEKELAQKIDVNRSFLFYSSKNFV